MRLWARRLGETDRASPGPLHWIGKEWIGRGVESIRHRKGRLNGLGLGSGIAGRTVSTGHIIQKI